MIEKLNFKKIEKHGLSTNELFNKINEMISDINANSYLNSENTIEMDNIIKRLEILEQKKGNSVAQQSDGNLEKALKVLEEHYEKNATKFDTADYFQVTYVIDFLRDLYQLKARTTDKEQPE